MSARVHIGLQLSVDVWTCEDMCGHVRTRAGMCKHMDMYRPVRTCVCGHVLTCTDMCGHSAVRRCMHMCSHVWACTDMCGHVRTCAGMCRRAFRKMLLQRYHPLQRCRDMLTLTQRIHKSCHNVPPFMVYQRV